jgi:hypothetical protein
MYCEFCQTGKHITAYNNKTCEIQNCRISKFFVQGYKSQVKESQTLFRENPSMNERTHSRGLCVPNSFAFKWTFKKTDREKTMPSQQTSSRGNKPLSSAAALS